jgi:hypothetical protein
MSQTDALPLSYIYYEVVMLLVGFEPTSDPL